MRNKSSQRKEYQKLLKKFKAAGITPGLGIGDDLNGKELAMKYLLRGVGCHVPDQDDKTRYPDLDTVKVELSWGPKSGSMSWMIDVSFNASDGRGEMYGFSCSATDHEVTASQSDLIKVTNTVDPHHQIEMLILSRQSYD